MTGTVFRDNARQASHRYFFGGEGNGVVRS